MPGARRGRYVLLYIQIVVSLEHAPLAVDQSKRRKMDGLPIRLDLAATEGDVYEVGDSESGGEIDITPTLVDGSSA